MILLTPAYILSHTVTVPIWHTRIGWHTIARGGSVSASSNHASGYVQAPVSDQTFEWWQPTSLPAWWRVDAGEAADCDYIGIGAHDLGSKNCTIVVQSSQNDVDWTDIDGTTSLPGNDSDIMILFAETMARYYRLRIISGDDEPKIGVIYIGKALEMIRPVRWLGHSPTRFGRVIQKTANMSERGQRLGSSLIRQGLEANFEAHNLDERWVRSTLDQWIVNSQRYGYFIAWRPTQFPLEVFFGWTDQAIVPQNSQGGINRKITVNWPFTAHAGHEIGVYP